MGNSLFPAGEKKRLPLWAVLLLDLLAVGLGLVVFALFHHVLITDTAAGAVTLVTSPPLQAVSAEDDSRETDSQETAPASAVGDFSLSFPEQFTDGEVISDAQHYRSENIALYYRRVEEEKLIYHTVEIFVRDIHYLKTAFAGGGYYLSPRYCEQIASSVNALAALSGDYYFARKEGIVVRNGVLYRDTPNEDVCVLWLDGTMECFSAEEFDAEALAERGAWQAWGFGPALMENGEPIEEFDHLLKLANPRAAIGYVEPGHYYFVMVEGRSYTSAGLTFEELSQLFASLGCRAAYNLDGGQSANLCWNGKLVNPPQYRPISDIIYVAEDEEAEK